VEPPCPAVPGVPPAPARARPGWVVSAAAVGGGDDRLHGPFDDGDDVYGDHYGYDEFRKSSNDIGPTAGTTPAGAEARRAAPPRAAQAPKKAQQTSGAGAGPMFQIALAIAGRHDRVAVSRPRPSCPSRALYQTSLVCADDVLPRGLQRPDGDGPPEPRDENRTNVKLANVRPMIHAVIAMEETATSTSTTASPAWASRPRFQNIKGGRVSPVWLDHHPAVRQERLPRSPPSGPSPQDQRAVLEHKPSSRCRRSRSSWGYLNIHPTSRLAPTA
jgi:hypothetical protein